MFSWERKNNKEEKERGKKKKERGMKLTRKHSGMFNTAVAPGNQALVTQRTVAPTASPRYHEAT
ncbi:hypothetical protein EYF80_050910 [Liparis tanakae]|uniref:Uncharacterized protein n=1 Tax=Liparis tanakae TaxID=230148 RepID=A0A4Z2FD69_9TELE|nr:hypothetical protein EYF80_050910 [Liparis tanakae]